MIDGIDEDDFIDDYDDDYGFEEDKELDRGDKCVHSTGIEGVVTSGPGAYYWITHSGGQEAFIHCGELSYKGVPTPAELEAYLGHPNGLPAQAAEEAST